MILTAGSAEAMIPNSAADCSNAYTADALKCPVGSALSLRKARRQLDKGKCPRHTSNYAIQPRDDLAASSTKWVLAKPTGLFYKIGRSVCRELKLKGDITIAAYVWRTRSGGVTGQATTDVDTVVSKTGPALKTSTNYAFTLWERTLRLYRRDRQFAKSNFLSE